LSLQQAEVFTDDLALAAAEQFLGGALRQIPRPVDESLVDGD
jgi:hypothetical protein